MNEGLLLKVKERIYANPDRFRMGAYITEIGPITCGCIAAFSIAEGEHTELVDVSAKADRTPIGYEAKRAAELLEITAEQGWLLFHLGMWPVEFRLMYKRNKPLAATKRITRFIETNGTE